MEVRLIDTFSAENGQYHAIRHPCYLNVLEVKPNFRSRKIELGNEIKIYYSRLEMKGSFECIRNGSWLARFLVNRFDDELLCDVILSSITTFLS